MKTSKKQKNTGKTLKEKGSLQSTDYEPYLLEKLKDLNYAAGYLTAAIEEGESVFLLAVKNLVKSQGGMTSIASATNLNRENLYNMLSKNGNPRLSNIRNILNQLGLDVKFTPKSQTKKAA